MEECKNCKREVQNRVKQCQYCGILNPTVKIKDVWIGIFIVLGIMSLYMIIFK